MCKLPISSRKVEYIGDSDAKTNRRKSDMKEEKPENRNTENPESRESYAGEEEGYENCGDAAGTCPHAKTCNKDKRTCFWDF